VLLDGQRMNENEIVSVRWSAIPIESIERTDLRGSGVGALRGRGDWRHDQHHHQSAVSPARGGASAGGERRNLRNAGNSGRVTVTGERTGLTLYANDYGLKLSFQQAIEQRNVEGTLLWFERGIRGGSNSDWTIRNLRLPGARHRGAASIRSARGEHPG